MAQGRSSEPKIPWDELSVERFRENADVRAFDCGNKDLNEFLTTEQVRNYESYLLGKTYLVYWQEGGRLVAYFTVSSQSLRIEHFRAVKSFSIPGEIRVNAIPGVMIGRLAVQKDLRRRDIGSHVLKFIAGHVLDAHAAARILFLEAYKESIEFYQSFHFEFVDRVKPTPRGNRLMYYDLMNHPERVR
jgi:GNAT superfamily N-acetyltransferase